MGEGWSTPSVARKVNREAVVVLGWGRAILLQLAHPLVAAGVSDHSRFDGGLRGYAGRAYATISAMLALTFGREEEALAVIARINAIHDRVHGTLGERAGIFPPETVYSARDPRLLAWVHATLLESMPLAYELFVGPLTRDEKDRYCAEAAPAGRLLGIPDDQLPARSDQLDAYVRRMLASGELCVTPRARKLARALLAPSFGPAAPLFPIARLVTAGLLPPQIRAAYGLRWSPRREWLLHRLAATLRLAHGIVPPVLREWPAARRAVQGTA